jgi:hypothetical protein
MKTNKMTERKLQNHGRGWVLIFSALLFLLFAGGPAQAQDVYKVTMARTGVEGLTTDCSAEGYVLAHADGGNQLASNGSDLEPDGSLGPELKLNIGNDGTPVAWERKYDVGDGLFGVFNGCFGGPSGPSNYPGALFIFFEGKGAKSTIRFTWHFEYYIAPGIREHFSLLSEKMPLPGGWTGGNLPPTALKGNFDFSWYLNDGTRKVRNYYAPIEGGQDRLFEFVLTIEKVQ